MKISSRDILIGAGIGVSVIGLVAIAFKKRESIADLLPTFQNYYGGKERLIGYPRGVRNNNPGNIEKTRTLWRGEMPHIQNTDGRFKQFYSYMYGVRAIILNIKAYMKKGYRSPRQIIDRWAPPVENNTESYIRFVSNYTGVPENSPVPFEKRTVQKLVEAIIIKENGKLYLSQGDFDKAWATTV